ncbi:YdaU family protein [Psychrobacter sp. LFX-11D]|jgi:uncharacterized protein YdaU (DUF1376 family)|uniref:YdaU family protein n=1 Tax=Psychrobacter sp. LFX-11D TaxID=458201 RepID=UPI00191B1062|nr:YdaU family protein [Psychrobacter sp. LFX-11D]
MRNSKNTPISSGAMHYVNHNFGDWELETRHMTRIEKGIYLDMRTNYLKDGKPFTSDVDLLAHRLSCSSDDERRALEIILKDKFKLDKRTKSYKHAAWETILKNYRAGNWRNSTNDTISSDDVTTDNSTATSNTPLTDAQRKAKSRDAEKLMRKQLSEIGVDSKGAEGMIELRKLFDTHRNKINSNYKDVATCHSESHAIVTQKEAITRKHKQENKNQKPFEREAHSQGSSVIYSDVQTDLVEQTDTNHNLSTHSYGGIEEWEAPVKSAMQNELSLINIKLEMTDDEYELHVKDFKIYYAEKAQNGKPLKNENIRKLRLRQWLQRVVDGQRTIKEQTDKRFNIDDEDWENERSSKSNKNDSREITTDVYHPSHKTSSTSKVKANPKINVVLNGLWRSSLPNMSVDETYTYIGQHQMPGESQDETYDRLIIEIQKEK